MAENIEFNIGSKGAEAASRGLNQAAGASEKLRGAMGLLSQASNFAVGSSEKLKNAIGSLSSAATGLQAAFAPLIAIFAVVKGVQGISNLIEESNEAYKIQEKAARGATQAQLEYTSQIQRVLGVGDEVSLGLMKQASLMGISKDKTDEATLAAIGLSKATGAGLEESLKKVNQALRGNANALGESIPGLQNLGTEQQKLAAISDLANRGLEEQKKSMGSLEGIQTRLSNSMGDLYESIGAILAPIRAVISYGWTVFAETMQSVLAPAVEFAKSAMQSLPPILDYVAKGVIGAITAIEVVITNLPAVFELAVAQAQLSVLSLALDIGHYFTSVIPAYASWFKQNFFNLISDAFSLTITIAKNRMMQMVDLSVLAFHAIADIATWFGNNLPAILSQMWQKAVGVVTGFLSSIGTAFSSAWDWITGYFSSGAATTSEQLTQKLEAIKNKAVDSLAQSPESIAGYGQKFAEILSRDLTQGFTSSTTPLPEIIGRQLTEREQQLAQTVAGIGGRLGEQFSDKFNTRLAAVQDNFKDFNAKVNLTQDKAAMSQLGQQKAQAVELKSVESRLLTRGRAEDPNAKVADNTAATVKELEKLNENVRGMSSGSNVPYMPGVVGI